ncbi:hypothetical protein SAMN05421693_1297 [Ectothiorhodospira magna]|uniref:DUF3619 family protein n=1 Tax=Ectothiorhodospira magna TaxID=867345 RepID=A0A1H9FRE3_9GAMM|nr:hypothetical protein [Ectothiorhodospira magna]SEQ40482.1 hypothetical protein SAMN05421693_1297 [Ectothiorhodospira magna]
MSSEDHKAAPWLARVRQTLDRQTDLSPQEERRLHRARQEAFARATRARGWPRWMTDTGRGGSWRPVGGLAVAASVTLAVVMVLNPGTMHHPPLPVALAELEDIEWVLDEGFWVDDPAFLQWVMEESG